jgi:acyl-homoserine lactone acylase PvdQ
MGYMHEQMPSKVENIVHIDQPYFFGEAQAGETPEAFGLARAQQLEAKILELGAENVAAFIGEPFQGAGGVIFPPSTYWPEIQRICRKYDILLVADEVICGFGRTGKMFGCDTYNIKPDAIVVSKQITSSYFPFSAIMMNDRMFEPIADESNKIGVLGHGYTAGGHPVAVFGPQTGYFAPQLLMLEELQGPGISARGAAFAGLNFYVELGRGPDYSWSATSAGQDITDTYAVKLCNTDGSPATKDSNAYLLDGTCTPMDRLERDDSWSPTLADNTAAGSYKLVMFRTKYGLVQSRATIGGVPVAYTSLRSTYGHEVDSIIGFQMLNDPSAVNSPQTFQAAAQHINYTFNWFYADSRHIAYYNSGDNPARPADVAPDLPTWGEPQYAWTGLEPASTHPQSVDQDYYVSWNNKQADDYSSAGFGDGSIHRANLLDTRVKRLIASGQKISRASLTQAMEDAAVTDLRGEYLLPELLKVVDSQPVTDPGQQAAVQELQNWLRDGTQRRETAPGSKQYADSDAVKTMDAWWPLLVKGVFQPDLGEPLYTALTGALQIDDTPYATASGSSSADVNESIPHKGSSFQFGWYSYLDKDLRAVLGEPVRGGLGAEYCGGGDLAQCRQVLLSTLSQASAATFQQVYPGDSDCSAGDQWCADAIIQRPLGGVTDPTIEWQNRPTYQQVVQYQSHR